MPLPLPLQCLGVGLWKWVGGLHSVVIMVTMHSALGIGTAIVYPTEDQGCFFFKSLCVICTNLQMTGKMLHPQWVHSPWCDPGQWNPCWGSGYHWDSQSPPWVAWQSRHEVGSCTRRRPGRHPHTCLHMEWSNEKICEIDHKQMCLMSLYVFSH